MIKLERCQTVAGFIRKAKTYQLILKDQQLLILELGNAMGPRVRDPSNPIGSAIGNQIANRIEEKYEKVIAQSLAAIGNRPWEELIQHADNKQIFLIQPSDVKSIKFNKSLAGVPKLTVKARRFKGTFHCKYEDEEIAKKIAADLAIN